MASGGPVHLVSVESITDLLVSSGIHGGVPQGSILDPLNTFRTNFIPTVILSAEIQFDLKVEIQCITVKMGTQQQVLTCFSTIRTSFASSTGKKIQLKPFAKLQ